MVLNELSADDKWYGAILLAFTKGFVYYYLEKRSLAHAVVLYAILHLHVNITNLPWHRPDGH